MEYGALQAFLAVCLTTASIPMSLLAADLFTKSTVNSILPTMQTATNNLGNWHDILSIFQARDIATLAFVLVLFMPFGIMYFSPKFKRNGSIDFKLFGQKIYEIFSGMAFAVSLAFFGFAYFGFHQPSLNLSLLTEPYVMLNDGFLFLISSVLFLLGRLIYDKKPFYSQSMFWGASMIMALWVILLLKDMQL